MPSPFPGVRAFFARFAFPLWQLRLEPVPVVCFHRVTSIFNYLQLRLERLSLRFIGLRALAAPLSIQLPFPILEPAPQSGGSILKNSKW